MNSVMRVIVVVLVSCSFHFLYTADKNQPVLSATEWFFRHLVLSEPHAEHASPYAWIIDSTKTIEAIACVDKEWNALHKKYIADPRKKLMQTHEKNFDAVHLNSLLCNKYAHYCCLVSKDKKIKALFGVVESAPSVFSVRPWQNDKPEPEHISSTIITYYDKQPKKIEAPAFQIVPKTTYYPQICIILPEEKQRYTLHLTSNSYGLTSCTPTLNKMIAATFELSEDPNFWHYYFSENGVKVQREGDTTDISIDLNHSYFKNACANIATLYAIKKSFNDGPCSCGTNHIDHECKENYETVCKILEEEGATHLQYYFLINFFENHIRHQIGDIEAGDHTKTLYMNPCGTIYSYTPCSNTYYLILHNPGHTPTLNIDSLQAVAATHAGRWRTMGNLLLPNQKVRTVNGVKKIQYFSYNTLKNKFVSSYLKLKDNEEVIDGITLVYGGNGYSVTIFVLQTPSKQTELLFGSDSVEAYIDATENQNILKRGLARILHKKNELSHTITAPEQEIVTFMHFIKKIKNPVTNLRDIYPTFDDGHYSPYYPFVNYNS